MNITKLNLINRFRCFTISYRGAKKKPTNFGPLKSWTGGVNCNGFTYFPRSPGVVDDPPIEPSKLFMVQRIKPFKGNHHKLKDILTKFGLGEDEKMTKITIVKNDPDTNRQLYLIKHLVKITSIKFMNGEPTPEDIKYGQLNEWGEFTIIKNVSKLEANKLEVTKDFINNPEHLDADTKKKHFRLQWINPYF